MQKRRPRILITHDPGYDVAPYVRAVELAGGESITATPGGAFSDDYDALLLSGGVDVDPALYGQVIHPRTETPIRERDRFEIKLLRETIAANKPVLAICRGMQLFNVAHGGTLQQHIESGAHEVRTADKSQPAHSVRIDCASRLATIVASDEARVNSRHHQAVGEVGAALRVAAKADDGTVEALELPEHRFAVAVQWHPENQAEMDPAQRRLFEAFIASAAAGAS